MSSILRLLSMSVLMLSLQGCIPNNPYRPDEAGKNYYYSTFGEPPKHLDPARAYGSNELEFITQIYETPLQYHYLKRPYELIPLTAEAVPEPTYFDRERKELPGPDALPRMPTPPHPDERSPGQAVVVCRLEELPLVFKEARDADVLQDSSQRSSPGIERTQGPTPSRSTSDDPGTNDREKRLNQTAPFS